MNALSIYTTYNTQMYVDRRGMPRTLYLKIGRNKGKVYPYRSARQVERQTGPLRRLFAAWDREDCVNAV